MDLLLICPNHHIFSSGLRIEGNITNLRLVGNKSICPYCRTETKWPEGRFDFINGIFREISEATNPDIVIREIKEDATAIKAGKKTSLKRLGKWLPNSPKKALVYAEIITALVAAYQLAKPKSNVEINVKQIINNYNTTINIESSDVRTDDDTLH